MTKEEIIQDILKGMEGIGGIPSNQEFYAEFDFRLRSALGLESENERLKAEREWIREKMVEKFNSLECQYNGKDTKKNRYWAGFGDAIVAFDNALLDLTNGLPQPPKQ